MSRGSDAARAADRVLLADGLFAPCAAICTGAGI